MRGRVRDRRARVGPEWPGARLGPGPPGFSGAAAPAAAPAGPGRRAARSAPAGPVVRHALTSAVLTGAE